MNDKGKYGEINGNKGKRQRKKLGENLHSPTQDCRMVYGIRRTTTLSEYKSYASYAKSKSKVSLALLACLSADLPPIHSFHEAGTIAAMNPIKIQ
jgi:hypothetical protein